MSLTLLPDVDPNVLVPQRPAGVSMRDAPLFQAHPLRHAYRSARSGLQLPVEFHAYIADNTTIVCLANAKKVGEFLKPIGYKPVLVRVGEKDAQEYGLASAAECAIVNIIMNDYGDTSAGPYRAMPLSIFAVPNQAHPHQNGSVLADLTAALLPLLDSRVAMIMGPLAMSKNQAALDVGRDVMGIDKFVPDAFQLERDQVGTTSKIVVDGKVLLEARVNDGSPEEQLDAQGRLFKQLGIFQSFKLLLGKNEPIEHPFIGWNGSDRTARDAAGKDQLPPEPAYCRSYTLNSPQFKLWRKGEDSLHFEGGCPLTDRLDEFDCQPILASRDHRVSVAVELDQDETDALRAKVVAKKQLKPASNAEASQAAKAD